MRVPAKNARGWTIEWQKSRVTRKECKRLREEFEVRRFTAQKGSWNIAKKSMLEDRGALPKEDGDLPRECQAMNEANLFSSWLREDVEHKEEERVRMTRPNEKKAKVGKERERKKGKG